jgi:DNA-binding transcriptional LysR family regulator
MTLDRTEDLEAFVAIVERGNQTSAARYLRRSLQSIGRSLAALERSAGTELVSRSTRRSGITEAGLEFYRRVKPALRELEEARREVANTRGEPGGLLRVAAPVRFCSEFVAPAACDFMQRYPKVEVELRASDRGVNVHEEGLDLALRIRELPDSTLKVRRLGELRVVVYGAGSYLAERGRPKHPLELGSHQCVVRSTDPDAAVWPFRVRGRRTTVRVRGRFRCDDTAACEVAVVRGAGLGMAPLWQIRPLLEQKQVELVLEEFEVAKLPIFAVSPPTRLPQQRTRLFIDCLAARLKRARL